MRILALLLSLCLLTGCSSLLEREYSAVEPHSSKFWESETSDTLRAENYQDIVNDLLILIGQHTEAATLRLYDLGDDLQVAELLDRAITEIRQETPMGAYAVEFITASREAQRGHYEVAVSIGYRRSAEQIQSVVSATSTEALYSLLDAALQAGKQELAVRIGYWGDDSARQVEQTLARLQEDRASEQLHWTVNRYPADGPVGLIEFLLSAPTTLEQPPESPLGEAELSAGLSPAQAEKQGE